MSSQTTGLAGRYAAALYELADAAKSLDAVAADLTALNQIVTENADLARLVRSPVIGSEAQVKAMTAVLEVAAVTESLRGAVGQKVAVNLAVDPSLIGGLIVRVGSRMVDSSLRSKINRLQLSMKGVG